MEKACVVCGKTFITIKGANGCSTECRKKNKYLLLLERIRLKPEKRNKYQKAYRERHPEKGRIRGRKWYEKNREKSKDKGKKWRLLNPEKSRQYSKSHSKRRRSERELDVVLKLLAPQNNI